MKKQLGIMSRKILQGLFLIYILFVSLGHAFNWKIGENLHGICPFGAIETFYTWITTNNFIHHTGVGNYFILLGLVFTLIISGAFFCGWICPFGTVQEFLGKLGKKIFKKKYNNIIPKKLDSILRYFKYLFLIFILVQTARNFKLVFENIDPYYTFFNIWSDEIAISGYIVLTITLLLSLIVERPYCKYMCPLGAINGIFNFKSIIQIKRDNNNCINCGACDKVCPVGINVSIAKEISDPRCIRCAECVAICPVNKTKDTLNFKISLLKNKKLNISKLMLISLIIFLTPIFIGSITGGFKEDTSDRKYETANDIKGSYTINEISEHYNITAEGLIHTFNIEDNRDQKLNDLLEKSGFSIETLRVYMENIDKPLKDVLEDYPEKYEANKTLRELAKENEAGVIAKLFNSSEEDTTVEIKRKTMLVEIKNIIKDYNDFLNTFNINKDEPLNTTLKDIIDKYSIEMEDIKTYVEDNKK
ncbi:4Fe-4S binding protein [Hypnocyclicus thermotrophus]|uniref:4Fe-4S binding protein n=1 Tax=Hypnocyclicus thermotrophus TaxID=1627895 RepID=A0AA46DZS8_9FUSO|nr:4Fe-4S binding protein [Hypnocyclicus thermotrophus]TDT71944.1 4Fe-4S binding protein [Hypnocyclicus thermotrophus]